MKKTIIRYTFSFMGLLMLISSIYCFSVFWPLRGDNCIPDSSIGRDKCENLIENQKFCDDKGILLANGHFKGQGLEFDLELSCTEDMIVVVFFITVSIIIITSFLTCFSPHSGLIMLTVPALISSGICILALNTGIENANETLCQKGIDVDFVIGNFSWKCQDNNVKVHTGLLITSGISLLLTILYAVNYKEFNGTDSVIKSKPKSSESTQQPNSFEMTVNF